MSNGSILVGILAGSKSDQEYIDVIEKNLSELGITFETNILSAHRDPEKVSEYAKTAKQRGLKVLIAAAGMAAALPGVVAAHTELPVIGVPLPGSHLNGVDALYAIVQMPGGIPVATMAIGKAGAKNAAFMAKRILDLS